MVNNATHPARPLHRQGGAPPTAGGVHGRGSITGCTCLSHGRVVRLHAAPPQGLARWGGQRLTTDNTCTLTMTVNYSHGDAGCWNCGMHILDATDANTDDDDGRDAELLGGSVTFDCPRCGYPVECNVSVTIQHSLQQHDDALHPRAGNGS